MLSQNLGYTPAVETRAKLHTKSSFLAELEIDHGPPGLLGRFFLAAENAVRDRGVVLNFASLKQGTKVQEAQEQNWASFPPMLDARLAHIPEDMSYCLLGRNARGQIVCCQGGRIYDLNGRSLADIVKDQSFFYGDGGKPTKGQPVCAITAPGAAAITGRFVYSGALWVHPDWRGQRLAGILPRISRAYALARWNTAFTVAFVSQKIANSPLLRMYGYQNVEPGVRIENPKSGLYEGCLLWMDADELAADLVEFMHRGFAEIDRVVAGGDAQGESLSAGSEDRNRGAGVAQAGRSDVRKCNNRVDIVEQDPAAA